MSYSEKCRECVGDGCLYHPRTGEPEVCPVCEGTGYITIKDRNDRREEAEEDLLDIERNDV